MSCGVLPGEQRVHQTGPCVLQSFETELQAQNVSFAGSEAEDQLVSMSTTPFVASGSAEDPSSHPMPGGGTLSVSQATQVLFCTAFGAGIAFVGWYPKLAGYAGYTIVLAIVTASAITIEVAMMNTAREAQAATFTDLCASLPPWMKVLTECSNIVWGFTLVGLYTEFVFSFINMQIVNEHFEYRGLNALPLYSGVGAAVLVVTSPASYSGPITKVLTKINLLTTWIVIVVALAKGITVMVQDKAVEHLKDGTEFTIINPRGVMQVSVLLCGSMVQCACVPQLSFEIVKEHQQRAAHVVPTRVALMQGLVFWALGLAGYFALGNAIEDDGDVFKAYARKSQDWMVIVLQGGIAILMYLSTPLVSLPAKAQLWAKIARCLHLDNSSGFAGAPAVARLGLNLLMVASCTAVPLVIGPKNYMSLLTIVAGIAANWINLFLPCMVIFFVRVRPAYRRGEPWFASAAKLTWILCLASASGVSSGFKIAALLQRGE